MRVRRAKRHQRIVLRGGGDHAVAEALGFTLVELLVVIVVLGLLASLVAPSVFQNVGAVKTTTARTQLEMLGAALDAYRLDNGRYPTTTQGLDALQRLSLEEPRPPNWRGPYLRKALPLDPWGQPYSYQLSASAQGAVGTGFVLASLGADGRIGGRGDDADIVFGQ